MKTLLVVDDDADTREVIAATLACEDYEVITACDGAKALQEMWFKKPDAILLDLVMPKFDGYQFLRVKNSDARLRNIPVIVFTASPAARALPGPLQGTERVILKPFDLFTLLDELKALKWKKE